MNDASREFLFTYRFDGAEWGISIFARDAVEAQEKIKAVSMARYDGELMMLIPASVSAFGLVPRIIVWWKRRRWLKIKWE